MSMLRPETLQVVAQSLGLDDLSPTCVQELLPEVELRVREVIQDALKFQRHSRRAQLDPTHINQALQARNLESLYGFTAPGAVKYRQCEERETLFFAEDEELELAEVLNAPLGQIPLQPMLNVHWLAVDGVQPLIPENESIEDDSTCHTSIKDEAFVNSVDRKPLVKHVLTEEMQLYYTKVTEAVKSDDFELQRAAFSSLARDPGIHQLLPYFSRFIYEEVKHSNHDLSLLFSLMRACRCLLVNQNLHVELYVSSEGYWPSSLLLAHPLPSNWLHQLIPAILTCVLGKQLCENPADDHWALRKYAAQLVAQICERYGETYANIQARVSKTYHKAITDPVSLDRGASPSLSPPALQDIVTLLYDAFGESLLPYIRPEQPTSMLDLCL
ncbi:hypothetical protein BBJ28_00009819 [Nothophytophthora sp. Chile5]|nr:hypothetical protein BBJ28_00009819 [Nothophytophthora sp. Chile5]